nr:hypothetical protein [Tanacetum cinerariifolium]
SISVKVPVASEVGAATVVSHVRVLKLDTHSSSVADPSESSPPSVSVAPMFLPFLCSDDSESDTEMPERHVLPTPHDAMLTRWRSRVASRSSSPTTFTSEILTAPILPTHLLLLHHHLSFHLHLLLPHLGFALTTWKSVRPVPSHRLALRYASHHLDHFTSRSSSGHSSSGHSILGHSLPRHSPPDTIIADSSTPSRFVHPPLARTPRCSEACHCWRFRDPISLEDSVKEDIDIDVLADIEANATDDEVVVDRDVEPGVDACTYMKVDVGADVEDKVESIDRGTIVVEVDVVVGIDIPD